MATSCSSASMSNSVLWRLVVDSAWRGSQNMAVDEALLDSVSHGQAPPTLRFYQWAPACLSLGYFQPITAVDAQACRKAGVLDAGQPVRTLGLEAEEALLLKNFALLTA